MKMMSNHVILLDMNHATSNVFFLIIFFLDLIALVALTDREEAGNGIRNAVKSHTLKIITIRSKLTPIG